MSNCEDCTCDSVKVISVNNFTFITLLSGKQIICQCDSGEITSWINTTKKIKITRPKLLISFPKQDRDGNTIGYSFSIAPMSILQTTQEVILLDSNSIESIEILGEIEQVDINQYKCSGKNQDLYNNYAQAVDEWSANMAGITSPTSDEIAAIKRGNVTPIRGK